MAISRVRSRSQALAASILVWRSDCSLSRASKSASGSAIAAQTSLKRIKQVALFADAVGDVADDVLRGIELWLLARDSPR